VCSGVIVIILRLLSSSVVVVLGFLGSSIVVLLGVLRVIVGLIVCSGVVVIILSLLSSLIVIVLSFLGSSVVVVLGFLGSSIVVLLGVLRVIVGLVFILQGRMEICSIRSKHDLDSEKLIARQFHGQSPTSKGQLCLTPNSDCATSHQAHRMTRICRTSDSDAVQMRYSLYLELA
jgi:hypothetical protein